MEVMSYSVYYDNIMEVEMFFKYNIRRRLEGYDREGFLWFQGKW